MQEFMLFMKTTGDHLKQMSPEQQQAHVREIGEYLGRLMENGQLKGSQPLEMAGAIIEKKQGTFKDGPFVESKEVIVGYFHILAKNLEEAIEIARANPAFNHVEGSMEIRPIKRLEGIN